MAFGVGTSEVEHVLATQCLLQKKSKNLRISIDGDLGHGVTAKDVILAIIGPIGTAGGTGYVMEYASSAVRAMSMEGRMTMCNMSIEAGARAGLIACDDNTLEYVEGRAYAPKGELWQQACSVWSDLHSDADARFDLEVELAAADLAPQVTWGT